MRKRQFTFEDKWKALQYCDHLMTVAIAFSVQPKADSFEVVTPFEISPADFPHPGDLQ